MPIRPENRGRYPANWQAIRAAIQARAANRCEFCGIDNHAKGLRDPGGRFWHYIPPAPLYPAAMFRPVRIVCTVAHTVDHDPANVDPGNLAFLCQLCHNRLDASRRAAGRAARRLAAAPAKLP